MLGAEIPRMQQMNAGVMTAGGSCMCRAVGAILHVANVPTTIDDVSPTQKHVGNPSRPALLVYTSLLNTVLKI